MWLFGLVSYHEISKFHAPNEVHVGIEEVTKDETKYAHIEDRRWEQRMLHSDRAEQDVDHQQCPH
jgi:hypothetical protein